MPQLKIPYITTKTRCSQINVYIYVYVCVYIYMKVKMLVVQSYPNLCNPMDCSLLGSSVLGILQARILE